MLICLECQWQTHALEFIPHEWSERSKCSEVKKIKKGHKIFHLSIYEWEGVCLTVCLSRLKS
jgi:hypothetical protein